VLLDKNSIVVAYDYVRGEPRGKATKEKNEEHSHSHSGNCSNCTKGCNKSFMDKSKETL